MDNKEFKKHLKDLVHGHHHPEEHDWSPDTNVRKTNEGAGKSHSRPKRAAHTEKSSKR